MASTVDILSEHLKKSSLTAIYKHVSASGSGHLVEHTFSCTVAGIYSKYHHRYPSDDWIFSLYQSSDNWIVAYPCIFFIQAKVNLERKIEQRKTQPYKWLEKLFDGRSVKICQTRSCHSRRCSKLKVYFGNLFRFFSQTISWKKFHVKLTKNHNIPTHPESEIFSYKNIPYTTSSIYTRFHGSSF